MISKNHILKQYIKYLKDNPEGYWFKARLYGYGWAPATWQGWLTTIVFIALIVANSFRFHSATDEQVLKEMLPQTFILVAILIAICIRTGEKPRWQWGVSKKDKK